MCESVVQLSAAFYIILNGFIANKITFYLHHKCRIFKIKKHRLIMKLYRTEKFTGYAPAVSLSEVIDHIYRYARPWVQRPSARSTTWKRLDLFVIVRLCGCMWMLRTRAVRSSVPNCVMFSAESRFVTSHVISRYLLEGQEMCSTLPVRLIINIHSAH